MISDLLMVMDLPDSSLQNAQRPSVQKDVVILGCQRDQFGTTV